MKNTCMNTHIPKKKHTKKIWPLCLFLLLTSFLFGKHMYTTKSFIYSKDDSPSNVTGSAITPTETASTPLPIVMDTTQVATPTAITAYPTKKGFKLHWKKMKDISGYEIQYSKNKNFKNYKSINIKNRNTLRKTIKKLKKNTKYYARIRAYKTTKNQIIYGDFSKEVSVKTAGTVTYLYKEGFYSEKISSAVEKRMLGKSYKKNEVISLSDLRYVRVLHYNYNGKIKSGELVVHKKIEKKVVKIFYELYQNKYPIQRMRLIDDYNADDNKSMEQNNTSAFNFRKAVGSTNLSKHAYGLAIDINPRINPYVKNGTILPKNGKTYVQRDTSLCTGKYKDNMIQKNDIVYKIFTKYGFTWGGDWYSLKDYQHFQMD